jgi:hypothetical protein
VCLRLQLRGTHRSGKTSAGRCSSRLMSSVLRPTNQMSNNTDARHPALSMFFSTPPGLFHEGSSTGGSDSQLACWLPCPESAARHGPTRQESRHRNTPGRSDPEGLTALPRRRTRSGQANDNEDAIQEDAIWNLPVPTKDDNGEVRPVSRCRAGGPFLC